MSRSRFFIGAAFRIGSMFRYLNGTEQKSAELGW